MSGCRGWSAGRATALAARTAELSPATSRALPADVAGADVAGADDRAVARRLLAAIPPIVYRSSGGALR
jgi:hypothetical protein